MNKVIDKQIKYKKWVVDDMLKNTIVEKYSGSINFTTPKGILQRQDDVSFYDDIIQVRYGIPDEYKTIKEIEGAYSDILVDMYWDYDIWPHKFKDGESVYDYLQRTKKPIAESNNRKQKYFDYIIKDLINDTELVGGSSYGGIEVFLPFDTLSNSYPPILSIHNSWKSWREFSSEFGLAMMAAEYLEVRYGFNRSDHYELLEPFWLKLKEKVINMSS
jgi:hypothetical protein